MNDSAAFDLIIFDCDGVLVDSEPIANEILAQCVTRCGWAMTATESTQLFAGLSIHSIVEKIETHLGNALPATFIDDFEATLFDALRTELQPMPGIHELLPQLDMPFCVATSAGHTKVRITLESTELLPHFEGRIFSSEDVARGKPAPDLFLHAAATMGAEPARCLVIEDSLPGIQAGLAAQMRVLGYVGQHGNIDVITEAGATPLAEHAELLDFLRNA